MNLRLVAVILVVLAVSAQPGLAEAGQSEPAPQSASAPAPEPSVEDVYVVLRDMDLAYETVEIRTIVPNEGGASALVGLDGGRLATYRRPWSHGSARLC